LCKNSFHKYWRSRSDNYERRRGKVDYVLWDWWEREWLLLLLRWVKKEMNVKTKVKMEIGVVVAAAVA
jgi:hypothetical protein